MGRNFTTWRNDFMRNCCRGMRSRCCAPLGDYDAVDPEFAQFDDLPMPNAPEVPDYCIPPDAGDVECQTASAKP